MKRTALIMAGGRGERFWPRSRKNLPKQFLSLTGDGKTMIQLTVERIRPLVEYQDIYIATNLAYKGLVMSQLPELPEANILCEPAGRNTAPCIGLGAVHIQKKYQDALMMVLPSDHLIKDNHTFIKTLSDALITAETGQNLITIGITPNYPETGYGYINFNPQLKNQQAFAVSRFVEKPPRHLAEEYVASGCYLWNSGMFVWKISSLLNKLKTFMPELYKGLLVIQESIGTGKETEVLNTLFPAFESESIDFGLMEKASDIYTLPGNFGWDDVGSWLAAGRIRDNDSEGNVVSGNVVSMDNKDCIIEGQDKLIAAVGLDGIIVVDTEDAILICAKNKSGDIKKVLEELRFTNREKYL